MNLKATIRIRVELWQDICKKCATKEETKAVRDLRAKVEQDMRDAALRTLRKLGVQVEIVNE